MCSSYTQVNYTKFASYIAVQVISFPFRLSALDYQYRSFPTHVLLTIFSPRMARYEITWPCSRNKSAKTHVNEAIVNAVKAFATPICKQHGKETYYEFQQRLRKRITSGHFKVRNNKYILRHLLKFFLLFQEMEEAAKEVQTVHDGHDNAVRELYGSGVTGANEDDEGNQEVEDTSRNDREAEGDPEEEIEDEAEEAEEEGEDDDDEDATTSEDEEELDLGHTSDEREIIDTVFSSDEEPFE